MNKWIYIVLAIVVLAVVVFLFAGNDGGTFFSPFNASVTITNQPPTVIMVFPVNPILGTAGQINNTQVSFIADDANGAGNIVVATATATYKGPGGTPTNTQTSCSNVACSGCSTNQVNISCTVPFDYYDDPGTYTINVTVDDQSGAKGANDTNTADYNQITAITNDEEVISWVNIDVTPSGANQTPTDSLTIRNQGNTVRTDLRMTAYDLFGNTLGSANPGENITSASFRASGDNGPTCPTNCAQCAASGFNLPLQHGVAISLSGESVPYGPPGLSQEEEIYFCIPNSLTALGLGDNAGYSVSAVGGQQWNICSNC